MVERQIVVLVVAGSNPVIHPTILLLSSSPVLRRANVGYCKIPRDMARFEVPPCTPFQYG